MPRLTSTTLALSLAATLLLAATPWATVSAAPSVTVESSDPLSLQITEMTPTVLRGTGDVTVSGTVTNTTEETWTGVNVAPFRSAYPITDSATLQAAAELPDDSYVGDRLTAVESITTVESLAPGETATFTTRMPRSTVGRAQGIYWVGVHASGQTETIPRDEITDGRARTFLPVHTSDARPLPAALLLELRHPVILDPDGALADPQSWLPLLESGGALHDVVRAGADADDRPVTWLVDPAVPAAVRQLARGNPARSLQPVPSDDNTPPDTDEAPADTVDGDEDLAAVRAAATTWLTLFDEAMTHGEVLALPYGDVDASALATTHADLLAAAHARSAAVLESFGISSTPALDSVDGHLSSDAVRSAGTGSVVLLSENAVNVGDSGPVPNAVSLLGSTVATLAPGIRAGGPGPAPAGNAVAVRQRVASEVVLRALTDDRSPLFVQPPPEWDAESGADELYRLFDARGLRMRTVTDLLVDAEPVPTQTLMFADEHADALVGAAAVRAAQRLVDRGTLLESVLVNSAAVDDQVLDATLLHLSQHTRGDTGAVRARLDDTRGAVDAWLNSIRISGPASVTLSGASGRIGATVVNDLPVPVRVNVEVESSDTLTVEVPNSVRLSPESRHRLLLDAEATQQGVQSLTLRATDKNGEPVGEEATFPVRSSEVTGVLWLMIGGGAVILFGAIIARLFRRGLVARRAQGVE